LKKIRSKATGLNPPTAGNMNLPVLVVVGMTVFNIGQTEQRENYSGAENAVKAAMSQATSCISVG